MPNYQKAYLIDGQNINAVHEKPLSVSTYNRCRYILSKTLAFFIDTILENEPKRILEAGVGDGRIFIPLARRVKKSTQLIGIDISKPMLNKLTSKLGNPPNITLYQADIRDKKFFKKIIDVDSAYTFATMHILSSDWKKGLDNLSNCLSCRGRIILGEEINSVFHGSENLYESDDYRLLELNQKFKRMINKNDLIAIKDFFLKYHELRHLYGFPFFRYNGQILHGDQSPAERYLRSKGFLQKTIYNKSLCWLKPHSFKDILDSIKQRTVTTLGSDLPDEIRTTIVKKLKKYCEDKKLNITKTMNIPSEIQLHIFFRQNE